MFAATLRDIKEAAYCGNFTAATKKEETLFLSTLYITFHMHNLNCIHYLVIPFLSSLIGQ